MSLISHFAFHPLAAELELAREFCIFKHEMNEL
jgi:hypothetical protein